MVVIPRACSLIGPDHSGASGSAEPGVEIFEGVDDG
jgi:hypothetical protein